MNKLLVFLGPTSTGKTDLALSLAKKFYGELVACDSRQVYRGLDIGTGKAPSGIFNLFFKLPSAEQFSIFKKEKYWEIDGVKVWLYDVADPKKQYSVADYFKDANKVIDEIVKRDKLPIIVGGTGLYLKALLEGLSNLSIPLDKKLRGQLQKFTKQELQEKLKKIALKRWEAMNFSDSENPRRLVRAIELGISPRRSPYGHLRGVSSSYNILRIGLTAPREFLYKRIDGRVIDRINQGMIEETSQLHKRGLTFKRMRELGLEYGVLADYLQGKIKSKDEIARVLQGKIHSFARRQITWFKKEKDVFWFDITKKNYFAELENLAREWYHRH